MGRAEQAAPGGRAWGPDGPRDVDRVRQGLGWGSSPLGCPPASTGPGLVAGKLVWTWALPWICGVSLGKAEAGHAYVRV